MKVRGSVRRFDNARRAVSLCVAAAIFLSAFLPTGAQTRQRGNERTQTARLGEEQRIVHVLNRLGFGPRPGDIERVRQLGIERYIEQQLNPEQIADAAVEARLRNLTTLSMSTGELLAKYPNPGQLFRQLQRRGELPPELAQLVEQRRQNQQPNPAPNAGTMENREAARANSPQMPDEPAMPGDDNPQRRAYRRAIAEYMRQNNLESPQRIMRELQSARLLRAVYSERQLQEVMVDFWTNHFNVFANKGADRWFLTSYDRDVIRPHALGNFRDLLEATAKSPAMLFYLDNFQSVDPNARMNRRGPLRRILEMTTGQQRPRRGINENYARELMELHTLGVEGGYTQRDVQEVARAFTGWTIIDPRGRASDGRGGEFVFNARLHDDGEKIVLGHKIPAGGGIKDGQMVLDILVQHPATARFVATKLSRRFVMDEPTPALVARVAAAFSKSKGDMRETLRALFTSPEFNSADARRAKIKTPFELVASAIRALGAETDARPALHQWLARMGEPLYMYQAPTGYPDRADYWVSTGALLERLNFALALVSNRIPGTRVDLARFAGEAATSSRMVDQERIVDQFLKQLLQGDISAKSRAVLMKQLGDQANAPITATSADETTTERNIMAARRARREEGATVGNPEVARIAALIVGSPEFQRQ